MNGQGDDLPDLMIDYRYDRDPPLPRGGTDFMPQGTLDQTVPLPSTGSDNSQN